MKIKYKGKELESTTVELDLKSICETIIREDDGQLVPTQNNILQVRARMRKMLNTKGYDGLFAPVVRIVSGRVGLAFDMIGKVEE